MRLGDARERANEQAWGEFLDKAAVRVCGLDGDFHGVQMTRHDAVSLLAAAAPMARACYAVVCAVRDYCTTSCPVASEIAALVRIVEELEDGAAPGDEPEEESVDE